MKWNTMVQGYMGMYQPNLFDFSWHKVLKLQNICQMIFILLYPNKNVKKLLKFNFENLEWPINIAKP